MPDFNLLNTAASDIKPPVPLPEGVYIAMVTGYDQGEAKTQEGPKPKLIFKLKLRECVSKSDDAAELPAELPELKYDFFVTDKALNYLKSFIETCVGRSLEPHETLGQMLPETRNQLVSVVVGRRQDPKDPEKFYAEIKKVGRPD